MSAYTGTDIIQRDILDLMGVSSTMPEEEKQRLYNLMLETVNNRIIARLADSLSDDDVDAWAHAIQANDAAVASDILEKNDLNINDLYLQEYVLYKAEMAAMASSLTGDNNG